MPRYFLVFLLFFSFFALTTTGRSRSGDGLLLFFTARSFVKTGDPTVPPVPLTGPNRQLGREGQHYAKFGPGLALAHLPALVAARNFSAFWPTIGNQRVSPLFRDLFWVQFTNCWISAFNVTLIFAAGLLLGASPLQSLFTAVAGAVASPIWTYATIDSTEALQGLGLFGAFFFLLRARLLDLSSSAFTGGIFLALAILAKVANAVLVPLFCLYVLLALRSTHGERIRPLILMLFPVAVAFMLTGAYNLWRFNSILDTGYDLQEETFSTPFLTGLSTLILSPSHGLVFFWPATALLPYGCYRLWQRWSAEVLLISGVFLTMLALYAQWWAYWGMHWGPRFLVPAIPLLVIFLLPLVTTRRRLLRLVGTGAILLGIGIQVVCVTTSYWQQVVPTWLQQAETDEQPPYLNPRLAPLRLGGWWFTLAATNTSLDLSTLEAADWARWKNREAALEDLAWRVGLEPWALSENRRIEYDPLWPPSVKRTRSPRSQPLFVLLLFVAVSTCAGLWGSLQFSQVSRYGDGDVTFSGRSENE